MIIDKIRTMREKHTVLGEISFDPRPLIRGYSDRWLRVDLTNKTIEIRPVTDQMKKRWTGGKGFDLWLTFLEISAETKWDSPENPICMSSGPLGGTASFPGTGKTLVTAISPATHSIMDSNVGGYFGPYLKYAGFDALCIVGKSDEETILLIDSVNSRIALEQAPLESIDSHLAAEEFTEMYADDEDDKRNIAVVSAGRAAEHSRMGLLNFSFYDWRRQSCRLKQAGRGGIGTVFRNKKLKAMIIKSRPFQPEWKLTDNPVAREFLPMARSLPKTDQCAIGKIVDKWHADPEFVIEMMQDIQDQERYISADTIDYLCRALGVTKGELYHIATFYKAFSLEPKGETVIQVCMGTACHVKGAANILDAFERELQITRGRTTSDGKYSLDAVACLGCCSLAPVVKIGDEILGNVQAKDVKKIIGKRRG